MASSRKKITLNKKDGRPLAWIAGGRLELAEGGADYLASVGRLALPRMADLVALPPDLKARRLVLPGCTNLAALPGGLEVRHLDVSGCTGLATLPEGLRCHEVDASGSGLRSLPAGLRVESRLDLRDCTHLAGLPAGLQVGSWIEIANTGITCLPDSLAGVNLRWRGVPIDERIAFRPEAIEAREIPDEADAGRRRALLERVGIDRFLDEADARVLDEGRDPGGVRRLLRAPLPDDEDLACVMAHRPSTGGRYLLRVPPGMTTCRRAVAWTAGFDDPSLCRPSIGA